MHIRSAHLNFHLATTALALVLCCAEPKPPTAIEPNGESGQSSAIAATDPCQKRPRCIVDDAQPINGLLGAKLLRVSLKHPDVGPDEYRCDGREYWLVRDAGNILIAADCTSQFGADTQGPAEIRLAGTQLAVRYVEFQEDDRCEVVEATVDLSSVQVERQERRGGSVAQDACKPEGVAMLASPIGDGSVGKPLLVLHRQ
jgi:hypothetical protein